MDLSARLREERKRLNLSQTAFGAIGGAAKTTVITWENGTASPNAAFLAAAAAAGLDVQYVVTGVHSASALSSDERVLLDRFRKASPERRDAALGALIGAQAGRSVTQHFGGASIGGDIVSGDKVSHNGRSRKDGG